MVGGGGVRIASSVAYAASISEVVRGGWSTMVQDDTLISLLSRESRARMKNLFLSLAMRCSIICWR